VGAITPEVLREKHLGAEYVEPEKDFLGVVQPEKADEYEEKTDRTSNSRKLLPATEQLFHFDYNFRGIPCVSNSCELSSGGSFTGAVA